MQRVLHTLVRQQKSVGVQLESLLLGGCLAGHGVHAPVSKRGLGVVEGQLRIIERTVSPYLAVVQGCKRHDLHEGQPDASGSGQSRA